jgi:hypothetical protein
MTELVEHELRGRFYQHHAVKAELPALRKAVAEGSITPIAAATRLLALGNP